MFKKKQNEVDDFDDFCDWVQLVRSNNPFAPIPEMYEYSNDELRDLFMEDMKENGDK